MTSAIISMFILMACGLQFGMMWRTPGGWMPRNPAPPARAARFTEALGLLMLAGVIELLMLRNPISGRSFLDPNALPQDPRFYLLLAGMLAMLLLGGALAWMGRLDGALAVMIIVFVIQGQGAFSQFSSRVARVSGTVSSQSSDMLEIRLSGGQSQSEFAFDGAELWANGVYLGKSPIKISMKDFMSKVPAVPLAPPSRSQIQLYLPQPAPTGPPGSPGARATPATTAYYLRARLGGEEGESYGFTSQNFLMMPRVVFPKRAARLEKLIVRARLADDHVDDAWWATLATFGEEGKSKLKDAAQDDPALANMVAAQEAQNGGANGEMISQPAPIANAQQAWEFLKKLMAEADRTQTYATTGDQGRALERVAPLLDPERLTRLAETMIPDYQGVSIAYTGRDGNAEFAYPAIAVMSDGSMRMNGVPGFNGIRSDGGGEGIFPPSAFVVAQAVRASNRALLAIEPNKPTIFQRRLVPQLLRWQGDRESGIEAAAALGGPAWMRYLERQNWRAQVEFGKGNWMTDSINMRGTFVNRWMYMLASAPGPEGDAFRSRERDAILDFADKLYKPPNTFDFDKNVLDFLFADRQLGKQSLAMAFWPRFQRLTSGGPQALQYQIEYLAQMGPQFPADSFGEVLGQELRRGDSSSLGLLRNYLSRAIAQLPPAKQIEALKAAKQVLDALPQSTSGTDPASRSREITIGLLRTEWDQLLVELGDAEAMTRVAAQLQDPRANQQRSLLRVWMANSARDHAMIEKLAQEPAPEQRAMAAQAIGSMPTAENRKLLGALLADSDPTVKAAAETAQQKIAAIEEQPLEMLKADYVDDTTTQTGDSAGAGSGSATGRRGLGGASGSIGGTMDAAGGVSVQNK